MANIEDSNWDSEFTCHLCSDKIPNVQLAYDHMIQKHSNTSKKHKLFANDKDKADQIEVNCIECDNGPFKGKVQFKIHLWRHLNSYEPPRRGRKKGAYPAWYERKIWTLILGGPTKYYDYSTKNMKHIFTSLYKLLKKHDFQLVVIPSMRTPINTIHYAIEFFGDEGPSPPPPPMGKIPK